MEQANTAIGFLLNITQWFVTMIFLVRILLQYLKVTTTNPIAQAILKMTQPILNPLQSIFPTIKGFNIAALAVLILVQFIIIFLQMQLLAMPAPAANIIILSLWSLLKFILEFYFWCIIISAVLSWLPNLNYNPLAQIIHAITAPVLQPIARVLPQIGGIDFSPVVALIILKLIEILVLGSFR